jgi:DNA replication protein DnaC
LPSQQSIQNTSSQKLSISPEGYSLWTAANIPERHKKFKFEDNKIEQWGRVHNNITDMLGSGFSSGLVGTRGCGKTQLSVCVIRAACKVGLSAYYEKAMDIFISLRTAFKVEGRTEMDVIKKYCKHKLLVIDTMENRGETPFEDRLLNHIIDKRYDNMLDTLLVSNQKAEDFAAVLGPSIVSRMNETGRIITCNWNSFR